MVGAWEEGGEVGGDRTVSGEACSCGCDHGVGGEGGRSGQSGHRGHRGVDGGLSWP